MRQAASSSRTLPRIRRGRDGRGSHPLESSATRCWCGCGSSPPTNACDVTRPPPKTSASPASIAGVVRRDAGHRRSTELAASSVGDSIRSTRSMTSSSPGASTPHGVSAIQHVTIRSNAPAGTTALPPVRKLEAEPRRPDASCGGDAAVEPSRRVLPAHPALVGIDRKPWPEQFHTSFPHLAAQRRPDIESRQTDDRAQPERGALVHEVAARLDLVAAIRGFDQGKPHRARPWRHRGRHDRNLRSTSHRLRRHHASHSP